MLPTPVARSGKKQNTAALVQCCLGAEGCVCRIASDMTVHVIAGYKQAIALRFPTKPSVIIEPDTEVPPEMKAELGCSTDFGRATHVLWRSADT